MKIAPDVQELFEKTFSKKDIEDLTEQRRNRPITVKIYPSEAKREIKELKFRLKCHKETIKELRKQKIKTKTKEVPKIIYKTKYKTKEVPIYFPNLNYLQFITFGILLMEMLFTII